MGLLSQILSRTRKVEVLPDEWKGYPLRKDYGIIQQDTEWVHINLGIESGQ